MQKAKSHETISQSLPATGRCNLDHAKIPTCSYHYSYLYSLAARKQINSSFSSKRMQQYIFK